MIFDFLSPEITITPQSVGGKYYHLYALNKFPDINVPNAFCISTMEFSEEEVLGDYILKKYAIRSSAVQEDQSGMSAAGIFESFLNIQGDQDIFLKIRECFKAVTSDRAIAYNQGSGVNIEMRVIVQEMVQPDLAGVLFTRNPINGNDEYYIQFTRGLGDSIVSGLVNPDTVIVEKKGKSGDGLLKALTDAALRIEKISISELDIEWAWQGNKLFILQARPLSLEIQSRDPSAYWTRANIGEIIPKPLTPLSWSVFNTVIFNAYRFGYYSLPDRFLTNIIHLIPRSAPKIASPKMFSGYLYLNLETIFKVFGSEPWVNDEILQAALGFTVPEKFNKYRPALTDKIYSSIKNLIFLVELIFPWISMENRVLKFVNKKIDKIRTKNSDQKIDEIVRFVFGWHLAVTARTFSHLGFMHNYLKRVRKLKSPLADLIGNLNAEHDNSPANNTVRLRSFNEFELFEKNGNAETKIPDQISHMDASFPNESFKTSKKYSKIYWYLLNKLKRSILLREQLKSILVKEYREFSTSYLKSAERLVAENLIDHPDDIFFLTKDEIQDQTGIESITERKKTHREQSELNMPVSFYGENPLQVVEPGEPDQNLLKGVGCSQGIFSGKVKILDDPDQQSEINDDDIIITKYADPGWTPFLLKSKGMITELGGILSHLATIAREKRIPLIVGVENATKNLHNDQKIEMNGQTGMIQLTKE